MFSDPVSGRTRALAALSVLSCGTSPGRGLVLQIWQPWGNPQIHLLFWRRDTFWISEFAGT